MQQNITAIGESTKKASQGFTDIIGKVLKFGIATLAINEVRQALMDGVTAVFEMDSALTEFSKVSDLAGESLDRFVEKATNAGESVARTGREMIQASTEFKKSGFGDEESLQLAKVASMFQNVADSELSASDASSFLISQMKAFNITAEDSIHIINAVNEVSNNFAVSSTDISLALSKTSSAMSTLGNSFEETIGLVTAGTELMTGQASKVSRGLRTIGNNIANMAQEFGSLTYEINGTTKTISLLDSQTGDLKSTFGVMSDIYANGWDKMSKAEQQALAINLAGKNQFEVFTSVLSNFASAQNATESAVNSAGSAAKENENVLDSLDGKVSKLQAQFEKLSNKTLSSDLLKGLIDVGTALLKFANSDVGQVIIKTTLLTTGLTLLGIGFDIVKTKIASTVFGSYIAGLVGMATGSKAAASAIAFLNAELLASPLFWVAAGGLVIFSIITAIENFNNRVEDATKKTKELTATIKTLEDELDVLNNKRKEEGLTDAEEKRLILLQAEIDKTRELAQEEAKRAEAAFNYSLTQNQIDNKKRRGQDVSNMIAGETNALLKLTEAYNKLEKPLDGFSTKQKEMIPQITEYVAQIDAWKATGNTLNDTTQKSYDIAQEIIQAYVDWKNSQDGLNSSTENATVIQTDFSEVINETIESLKFLEKIQEKVRNGQSLSIDEVTELIQKYPELEDKIYRVANGWKIEASELKNAATESYNTRVSQIQDEIDKTNTAIAQTKTRILLLQTEAKAQQILKAGLSGKFPGFEATSSIDRFKNSINITKAQADLAGLGDVLNGLEEQLAKVNDLSAGGISGSSSSGSKKSKEKDPIKEQSDLFKEQIEILEHIATLKKENGATDEEQIASIKEIQDKLHEQANWFRDQGLTNESEYVRALQQQWWKHEHEIEKINEEILKSQKENFDDRLKLSEDYISDRNFYDDWGADSEIEAWQRVLEWMKTEYYEKGLIDAKTYAEQRKEVEKKLYTAIKEEAERAREAKKKALEDEIDDLQKRQDAYDATFDYMVSQIDKELDLLEKEKNEREDYWENQIDSEKDYWDERIENTKNYYDEEINKINEVNDELNDKLALEKALEELARAQTQRVLIYKDGMFQYGENSEAISKAQENLNKVEREQALKKQVNDLKKAKEEELAILNKSKQEQLALLEQQRQQELQNIESRIQEWERYKQEWSSVYENYKNEQNRLLAEQVLGIELEGNNWKTRLDNLQEYANEYISILEEMKHAQSALDDFIASSSSDTTSGGGSKGGSGGLSQADRERDSAIKKQMAENSKNWHGASKEEQDRLHKENQNLNNQLSGVKGDYDKVEGKWHFASGTTNAPGGISTVGEHGRELRVLNQGDGIIPNRLTENLMEWGKSTPMKMFNQLKGIGNSTSSETNYNFDKLVLPNVSNANQFLSELQNFKGLAHQRAYQRA